MSTKKLLLICFIIAIVHACSNDDSVEKPDDIEPEIVDTVELNCFPDSPVPKEELEQDPLPIVQGKILSWAVSTDDEIAYTPPGKWVNIYGKTYYRYVERAEGAELKVNQIAASASNILTSEQINIITAIVSNQTKGEIQAITNRGTISRELIKFRNGENADEDLILKLANDNGIILGELVKQGASAYGEVFKSLTNTQKNALCEKRKISDHENSSTAIMSALGKAFTKDEHTVLNMLMADFFIWATGVEDMNKYVDAGRAAVFFGFANLRVEDRAGEEVSSGLRGESSKIIDNVLDDNQHATLDQLIIDQEKSLAAYYSTRADLAHEVMSYQSNNATINLNAITTIALNSEVVEAELAIIEAKAMASIIQSFSDEQMQVLLDFKYGNGD